MTVNYPLVFVSFIIVTVIIVIHGLLKERKENGNVEILELVQEERR